MSPRNSLLRGLSLLLLLLGAPPARAATQAVAVLPFRDLAGAKGSVGEAIRETVTSDLKEISELKVIERAFIDKVLAEQKLGSQGELDPAATVKLGKLVGASLMVAGAYQRAGATVRLTARFIRVETGEIVGTAKVDGPAADFLGLQDRVTAELLRSAGLSRKQVDRVARRTRPKLKSFKAVEYYGEALAAASDEKRVELLRLAVAEDSGFSYAVRDLEALERRMRAARELQAIERKRQAETERERLTKALAELHGKGAEAFKDQATLVQRYFSTLLVAHRYREMASEGRRLYSELKDVAGAEPLALDALANLVQAEYYLKDIAGVLRDGDTFQRRFPTSDRLSGVQSFMQQMIDRQRRIEGGRAEAEARMAKATSEERWDLCRLGDIYRSNAQYREAQRLLRACHLVEGGTRKEVLRTLIEVDLECADWSAARQDLAMLEKLDTAAFEEMLQRIEYQLPEDG